MRARDLGITIGNGVPGRLNAITDVPGVAVGHSTIVEGDGPLVVGRGPIRTGVTVVVPHDGDPWMQPVYAGCHTLNGNGELTGLEWIREAGLLAGPVAITNTHSVGVVRDALIRHAARAHPRDAPFWSLPVVGETYDGTLNDINGFHVRPEHVDNALAHASPGPVEEGGVGGGTGMICHEFKGGIGTASRVIDADHGGWTVGVLVQANYGRRSLLRVDGVPVGESIPTTLVSSPYTERDEARARNAAATRGGSIIIVVATDAPLLPLQCRRVAQRAGLGLARTGGLGMTSSGDLFIAFSTGNRAIPPAEVEPPDSLVTSVRTVIDYALDPIFEATVEATEEAIVNALVAAKTMIGRDSVTAHALPADLLVDAMARFGRGRAAVS